MLGDPLVNTAPRVRVLDSIHAANKDEWDAIREEHHYSLYEYFVALENSELNCTFRYIIVEQNGEMVGYSYGYVYDFPISNSGTVKTLIVASPFNVGTPFMCTGKVDAKETLKIVMREWESVADHFDAKFIVFRDLWLGCDMEECESVFEDMQYKKQPIFLDARLYVKWSTLDQLISQFRRKVRITLKHDMQVLESKGYVWTIIPGTEALQYVDEMQHMWVDVYERHRDPDQLLLPTAYFREMLSLHYARVLCLFKGEILVSYGICYTYGDLLEASYCGVNYGAAGGDPVQRSLITQIVKYGIEQGFREIDIGVSNETVKSRLGAFFIRLHAYTKSLGGNSELLEKLFCADAPEQPIVRAFRIPDDGRS